MILYIDNNDEYNVLLQLFQDIQITLNDKLIPQFTFKIAF